MTATILPFRFARRVPQIEKTAAYMLTVPANHAEGHLREQLRRSQPTDAELLVLTLLWTGARVSEVLALTPQAFQLDAGLVALRTLKRRRPMVREVPVPPAIMAALAARFGLRTAQAAGEAHRLWPCSRVTAWRQVKALLAAAGIHGSHACPKGLRHGFGVATVQSGTPITLTQRWMGHKKLETTAIYTDVMGPEERGFANAFFAWSGAARP